MAHPVAGVFFCFSAHCSNWAVANLYSAPRSITALPKKLSIQFARFIVFASLRGGAAFVAHKTLRQALENSGLNKTLEEKLLPQLSPLTGWIKEGLAPVREQIVAQARSTSWSRDWVLWADDPKPEQKIENRHVYPIVKETALITAATTLAKILIGGSFFNALGSYAVFQLAVHKFSK